ncbi:ABC transporter substrate-binding protein, partial [Candidatus Hodarchaeum mangrovi]
MSFYSLCRRFFFLLFYFSFIISPLIITPHGEVGQDYFFSVNMLAPISGPLRLLWEQMMVPEFAKIGIKAELDYVGWPTLYPRSIKEEVGAYKDGGYDLIVLGTGVGSPIRHLGDGLQGGYGTTAIPPAGFNIMYWANDPSKHYMTYRAEESNNLIQRIRTNYNRSELGMQLVEWQKIWYDVLPHIVVYTPYDVHAISSTLYGYDPVFFPFDSLITMWGRPTVTFAVSGCGPPFNPIFADNIYDIYSVGSSMAGLVQHTPSKYLVLPMNTDREAWMTTNFGTTEYLKVIPRIATERGNYSNNGLQYNITLCDNVFFHDGHQLDGWDVAFSLQVKLIPTLSKKSGSNSDELWAEWILPFGLDDKVNHRGNYSVIIEDKDDDGFFEHISFNFVTIFPSFVTDVLDFSIFPEHILGDPVNHGFDKSGNFDPNLWLCKPSDWSAHSFNTGHSSDPGGLNGPIGAGPVVFKEYNATKNEITFEKFDGIQWDHITKTWVSNTSLRYFEFSEGKWFAMPTSAKVIMAGMDIAIAEMKLGMVDILDPWYMLRNVFDEIQAASTITPVLTPASGWQSLYMNPKFEEGGIYHLNKKGVRHAISHIIPREEITDKLWNGLAIPAYTPIPITSWAAISETDLLAYKKTL